MIAGILLLSSLCLAQTDVCAPVGSSVEGELTRDNRRVIITPSRPMKALGATFRSGTPLSVEVHPWQHGKEAGAIVLVSGELERVSVISGALVEGSVRIGQVQDSKRSSPQLLGAAKILGGYLQAFDAGTIDLDPGMIVSGSLDFSGGSIFVKSATPVRAIGLDFSAGTVRINRREEGTYLSGTLARPQKVAGVLLKSHIFYARIKSRTEDHRRPLFRHATVVGKTSLKSLGLAQTGTIPADTEIDTKINLGDTSIYLMGPGPFTVCGLSLVPVAHSRARRDPPAVIIHFSGRDRDVAVYGQLAKNNTEVGHGIRMSGPISARFKAKSCERTVVSGRLEQAVTLATLPFQSERTITVYDGPEGLTISGTLAKSSMVNGYNVRGDVEVRQSPGGSVELLAGVLAREAVFKEWLLPAGTSFNNYDSDNWEFLCPRGKLARAVSDYRGRRLDRVIQADAELNKTSFRLKGAHRLKGTKLNMMDPTFYHDNDCAEGGIGTKQRIGMFVLPADSNAVVCGTTLNQSKNNSQVIRAGHWFATTVVAGSKASDPTTHELLGLFQYPKFATSVPSGYWLQVSTHCLTKSIHMHVEPERWLWIDLKGNPATAEDRKALRRLASKPGSPCPVMRSEGFRGRKRIRHHVTTNSGVMPYASRS